MSGNQKSQYVMVQLCHTVTIAVNTTLSLSRTASRRRRQWT